MNIVQVFLEHCSRKEKMTTTDRRLQLKATLLDAAERIIADQGLAALRARDLARDAGCAVGAIYNAVPDLDTLILEVNLRTLALFEGYIARLGSNGAAAPGLDDIDAAVAMLVELGSAYLAFANDHPNRWQALFQHRLAEDKQAPDWYVGEQVRLFGYIETPLQVLCPGLSGAERHLLARTLFSASHGVVSLGLDKKLLALPVEVLKAQIEILIRATAKGMLEGEVKARPDAE
jgi:AcrR family transcriptional regulator